MQQWILLLLASLLLGFVWAGVRASWRLADHLPEAWEGRDIELTGVVAALPQVFPHGERFIFDVETVHTAEARVPRRIALSWYGGRRPDGNSTAWLVPGERWRLGVRLKRPHGHANPHAFDYEAWLLERGIRATGTVRKKAMAQRLESFVPRPAYAVQRLRAQLRSRFITALPDASGQYPYVGVLTALAIGDQRAIPDEQWQTFNRVGITHLVSISGLHVTMVAALLATLVNILWRRSLRLLQWLPAQKAAVAGGWCAALAYALIAGFEVPTQRTLYMLSALAVALCSDRHFGPARILALALLSVLLFDPFAVLATGFWLSFGAVALLLLAASARLAGTAGGWRAVLAAWGAAQWAVTIGSLPLLLFFFQQFSLVSPLANAVAIPLVSFVVTPLALLFAALPWPPLLLCDHWIFAQLMKLLVWLAQWPAWQQAVPPPWAVTLALLGVVWLLLPRGFPARAAAPVLFLPALLCQPARPPHGAAWVDVLDVGQGSAVVVRTAAHTLLYDAGPAYSAQVDAGRRVIVPYLRAVGVDRLDTLLISHRDKDHAGGLAAVRDAVEVGQFVSSMPEADGQLCAAGQRWQWDGVAFEVLHPVAGDYAVPGKKSNNLSCVLRVASERGSMLLSGDIVARDEQALLGRVGTVRSEVLLVPHHGSNTSSSVPFINAVAADDVVVSAGYRNHFRHPRAEVVERYAGRRLWRTDRDGRVRVELQAAGQTPAATAVYAWRRERRRYWHLQ